jgi:Calcineurin-like phosphoesterase
MTTRRCMSRVWVVLLLFTLAWAARTCWWYTTVLPSLRGSSRRTRPCLPWNFHLSPASNVDLQDATINMTLSFTVPRECHSKWTPLISYGGGIHPGQDRNATHTTTGTSSRSTVLSGTTTTHTTLPNESLQFSFSNYLRRYQSSQIYHAILSDIQAGSLPYWYTVDLIPRRSNDQGTRSSNTNNNINHRVDVLVRQPRSVRRVFYSPPLPSEPVRLALIGDWGASHEAVTTMKGMLWAATTTVTTSRQPPLSAIIVAGDISYANANLPVWEDFLNRMEPLFSTIPLLVTPGNHEIECNRDDFQVFQAYEHYFRVPNRIRPAHRLPIPKQFQDCTHPAEFQTTYEYGNSFYSYRHGMLQVIVLNSYTNTTKGSPQYEWLVNEFKHHIDRKVTPWLLVVFHCPFHTTFRGHNGTWWWWLLGEGGKATTVKSDCPDVSYILVVVVSCWLDRLID